VAEHLPPVEKGNDTIHDKISKDFKIFYTVLAKSSKEKG
jgi:hypothetical protein